LNLKKFKADIKLNPRQDAGLVLRRRLGPYKAQKFRKYRSH